MWPLKVTLTLNCNQNFLCRQIERFFLFVLILVKLIEHTRLGIYSLIHEKVVLIKDDIISGYWASHFSFVRYVPVTFLGRGRFEDASEPWLWISMHLTSQGFIYKLTAPNGRTVSKDLALTLLLDATTD